jgi:UDP-glucose 6-dehydrogenase
MKKIITSLTITGLTVLAFGNVNAQEKKPEAMTREQVRAELIEAQRTGDIVVPWTGNKKLNELYPNQYPKVTSTEKATGK